MGHFFETLPVQLQPVDHRLRESAASRLDEILFVRGKNDFGPGYDLVRHGQKRIVFPSGAELRERTRGEAGAPPVIQNIFLQRHHPLSAAEAVA